VDIFNDLLGGFAAAMTWQNLLFAFLGCLLGTIIGVLPGIGPVAGVALLIPLTLNMDPAGAIIMLCAIFYGTAYGGTITSVLLNTPGEAASAITTIDGYAMTKIGKAGAALTIAAVGSFVGGTIATIGLVAAAKPLGELGLLVGPPEFFALMVVGISLLVALAGKSMVKAVISGALGLLISMVGIDPVAGAPRFTFGMDRLLDGVSFVAVIVGVFGLSELLS
jgi:putative tricarboxylic transport membrane protein